MKNFYLLIAMLLFGHHVSAQCGTAIINPGDSCFGTCNAAIIFTPSSGTPPYNIVVNGGPVSQFTTSIILGPICPGIYHYVLTDAIVSCIDSGNVIVGQPTVLNLNLSTTNETCPGAINGSITISALGGSPPYQYSVDGGITWTSNPVFNNLPAGNYMVSVMDSHMCMASTGATISTTPLITVTVNLISPSCGQCDGSATSVVIGGTPPFTYLWTPGALTTPGLINVCSALSSLTVTDANGCFDSTFFNVSLQCDSVWPGDANYDGIADNNDVLALGINYNATGPVRPGATNAWTGQVCPNWPDTLVNGINIKHSDCDGNGIVNADDTLPISLNYGSIHPRLVPPVHHALVPDLYLEAVADTTGPNQLLHVKIHLGSASTPVPSIYGLAFTISLDPTLIDTTSSVSLDCSSSALGTIGTNLMSFSHARFSAGAIDVAITKTDHLNALNIDSVIGILTVVITDNVSTVEQLRFDVSNLRAINYNESPVVLNSTGDSVVVDPSFIGIQSLHPENSIVVFPTPTYDYLKVSSGFEVESVEFLNSLGEKIVDHPIHQKNFSLDMMGIQNGIYFLSLKTEYGFVRKKIFVMH